MENSLRIIKQIESTHRGLGISVLFGIICYLGKISVIYLGDKGKGKGTTISAIKTNLDNKYDMIIDNLTLTELGNKNELQFCHDKTLVWRIKEWSTMNQWNRTLFLTIGSKIITDHEYYHYLGDKKGIPIVIDIANTDLICYIGIQPLKMSRLMTENENWESLASDRFIKWIMLNPLRTKSLDYPPQYEMPDIDYELQPDIENENRFLMSMLKGQVSPERLPLYAQRLMRGYAILEGIESPRLTEQMELAKFFRPFISLYPQLLYSIDLDEETKFAVGSLRLFTEISQNSGISIDELQHLFAVYEKKMRAKYGNPLENAKEMINRHASMLTDRGLITVEDNSPRKFYLNDTFTNYFNWYSDLVK